MKNMYSFISGFLVATLGGLIGLGGAEFRLPILVGFFSFATLNAVIINKVVSLAVVLFSLIFRSHTKGASQDAAYKRGKPTGNIYGCGRDDSAKEVFAGWKPEEYITGICPEPVKGNRSHGMCGG
jgi:hypothetical protein